MIRAMICFVFGHRWRANYELDACPLPYWYCDRCGGHYHYCNNIDWSRSSMEKE